MQLLVGQRLAVDRGVDEQRGEIVGNVAGGAAVGDQLGAPLVVLTSETAAGVVLRLARVQVRAVGRDREEQVLGPVDDVVPVGLRHPEQVADRRQRHAAGELLDEVDRLGRGGLCRRDERRDGAPGEIGELLLEAAHRTRGEAAQRDHPQVEVLGPVEEHHVDRLLGIPAPAVGAAAAVGVEPGEVVVGLQAQEPAPVAELLGTRVDRLDVVVARHGPERREPGPLVPGHRGEGAQPVPVGPGVPVTGVAVDGRDVEVLERIEVAGRGHRSSPRRRRDVASLAVDR